MLMTQADVARKLKVARSTISEATRAGILKHVLLPGHRKPRYLQKHIDDFLERSEQGQEDENQNFRTHIVRRR